MTAADMATLVQALAPAVKQAITSALLPVQERIAAIEARQAAVKEVDVELVARLAAGLVPKPADGLNGKDADEALLQQLRSELDTVAAQVETLKALPAPVVPDVGPIIADGIAAAVAEWRQTIDPIVADHVRAAVAALPPPVHGQDGAPGAPGLNGKDGVGIAEATLSDQGELVLQFTDGSAKALGVVVGKDGTPGEPGRPGEKGDPGRDGVGLAGAIIDKDGTLVVTLSDGRLQALGKVVGDDGAPGAPGVPGQDGKDGFGVEDMDVVQTGERSFAFQWTKGDRVEQREFRVPVLVYKEIWQRDAAYEQGHVVTYGGSLWAALKDAPAGVQPGTVEGASTWRLCVKKGDNGKPGERGQKGDPGPKGKDGVDPWQR